MSKLASTWIISWNEKNFEPRYKMSRVELRNAFIKVNMKKNEHPVTLFDKFSMI